MIHLSDHPDQRRRLVEDPSLIPSAVEELLRLDAPVAPGRVVVKPVTLHGVTMQPGDRVLAFLSAANRDESEFECPHAVQLDRAHNRHITFSAGPHRCVGSNLARVELAIALEEIHRRIPDYQVDPDRPPTFHHSQVRGVRELHLTYTPQPAD
jgi:cytochrome P450